MKRTFQIALAFYSGLITLALLLLLYSFKTANETFEELTVKRINIVDENGTARMVISNQERMEPPIIMGKKYERSLNPAGIIFYDENGNECGGIAISKTQDNSTYALAFDYSNADAIGLFSQQNSNSNAYRSGLTIKDKHASGKIGKNTNRINLMTDEGNSSLVINGPDEKPRITLSVDSNGNPSFQIIDNAGNVIKEINE